MLNAVNIIIVIIVFLGYELFMYLYMNDFKIRPNPIEKYLRSYYDFTTNEYIKEEE